jgi:carboxymethylenebutenolidase
VSAGRDAVRSAAIALYDRFTHEGMDRRAFMAQLSKIAGGTAAASALLVGIAANPAAAAAVAGDDKRVRGRPMQWPVGGGRTMSGYQAEPARPEGLLGSVMVIHENRGLNEHTRDVARRVAVAGYRAVAPDFLSTAGGTPADQDAARDAIGKLDLAKSVADAVTTLGLLRTLPGANGRAGAVGFCWGGGMVNRIAVAAGKALDAGVSFYGPAPDPSQAAKVEAAMLIHLAELDTRVNATGLPWGEALKAAAPRHEVMMHAGVNHAFHNDTSAERYDRGAAERAWGATLRFFGEHLRSK